MMKKAMSMVLDKRVLQHLYGRQPEAGDGCNGCRFRRTGGRGPGGGHQGASGEEQF